MTLAWSQPAAPAAEFRRLLELRDLAAYRAVSAVELVIHFFEAQDYDTALASLKRAHHEFEDAQDRVSNFYSTHKGESDRHGNRSTA